MSEQKSEQKFSGRLLLDKRKGKLIYLLILSSFWNSNWGPLTSLTETTQEDFYFKIAPTWVITYCLIVAKLTKNLLKKVSQNQNLKMSKTRNLRTKFQWSSTLKIYSSCSCKIWAKKYIWIIFLATT